MNKSFNMNVDIEKISTERKDERRNNNNARNAFQLLMSGSKQQHTRTQKRPHTTLAQLVECPVCSKIIPDARLNDHLDACMAAASSKSQNEENGDGSASSPCSPRRSSSGERAELEIIATPEVTSKIALENKATPTSICTISVTTTSHQRKSENKGPVAAAAGNDAFAHMIERSVRLFSQQQPVQQRFHLHADLSVTWYSSANNDCNDNFISPDQRTICIRWSNSTMIRKELSKGNAAKGECACNEDDVEQRPLRNVDLILSSSVQSAAGMPQIVRRLSRLSVPVLKSVLQKSIRRRSPLPSVRVAMELASKSWGDLVRRLPIIMLEDSSLHPDLPLLVWVMAADSKGFIPPPCLIARVMRIVFEVASCPWKNVHDLMHPVELSAFPPDLKLKFNSPISLRTKQIDNEFSDQQSKCALFLRSMLLRGQYGGMACDIEMIVKYVAVWRVRFHGLEDSTIISKKIAERFSYPVHQQHTQLTSSFSYAWVDIPLAMHQIAMENSAEVVNPLVVCGIDCLLLKDFALAGIDFHCSPILEDVVLSDQVILDSIIKIFPDDFVSAGGKDKHWIKVLSLMKEVMWKYSAGINRRSSIMDDDKSSDGHGTIVNGREKLLQQAWAVVSEKLSKYAQRYVKARLAIGS